MAYLLNLLTISFCFGFTFYAVASNHNQIESDIEVGEIHYLLGEGWSRESSQLVKIIEREADSFSVQSLNSQQVLTGVSKSKLAIRKGCVEDFCVGQMFYFYNPPRRYVALATVLGIGQDQTVLVRFEAEEYTARVRVSSLAKREGCIEEICVGQLYYNEDRENKPATVVGIQSNGKLILRNEDAQYFDHDKQKIGSGWDKSSLKKID